MHIDWERFGVISPLLGGIMIGLASEMYLLCCGRISGISGLMSGLFARPPSGSVLSISELNQVASRFSFLFGLITAGSLIHNWLASSGLAFPSGFPTPNALLIVISGLLVGVGTKMGNGCTSGHGVCGLGRLSLRSLVATLTFMATGMLSTFLNKQFDLAESIPSVVALSKQLQHTHVALVFMALFALLHVIYWITAPRNTITSPKKNSSQQFQFVTVLLDYGFGLTAGALFGAGLAISQMTDPSKVLNFLNIGAALDPTSSGWDPSLMFVMGSAVGLNVVVFRWILKRKTPIACNNNCPNGWGIPTIKTVDWRLVIGSALFGLGWGITGICPGPALIMLGAAPAQDILVYLMVIVIGMTAWNDVNCWLTQRTNKKSR